MSQDTEDMVKDFLTTKCDGVLKAELAKAQACGVDIKYVITLLLLEGKGYGLKWSLNN